MQGAVVKRGTATAPSSTCRPARRQAQAEVDVRLRTKKDAQRGLAKMLVEFNEESYVIPQRRTVAG